MQRARRPRWLSDPAVEHWKKIAPALVRNRVLADSDAPALALLCEALAEYETHKDFCTVNGWTYDVTTVSGATMTRVRPQATIAVNAWRRAAAMMREFGMTPSSRRHAELVDVEGPGASDDTGGIFD